MTATPECLVNQTTGVVLAEDAVVARTFWGQLIGFIGRRKPWPHGALGIPHCDRVHTFWVNRPLDVMFCAKDGLVLRVIAGLVPCRVSPWVQGAYWVWEAEAGTFAPHIRPGETLAIEPR